MRISPTAPDRFDQLKRLLWGPGIDSTSRADALMMAISQFRGADWWRALEHHWSDCDAVDDELSEVILHRMRREPGRPYDGGSLTLYRGCSRSRIYRFPWTAEHEIARRFAVGHRGIHTPDPVIVTAHAPAEAIFLGPISDRDEAEYLVDPELIEIVNVGEHHEQTK